MSAAEISHAIQTLRLFTAVRQSSIFYPAVMATHLTCIAIFGGMILVTNLRLLGLALTTTPIANVIESTRMWKRWGLVLMVSCGILLAGSRLDTCYANPYFQTKLVLLVLIFVHGRVFRGSVYRNREAISVPVARLAGVLSLILWLGIVSCGRWIAYYDPPEAITRLMP